MSTSAGACGDSSTDQTIVESDSTAAIGIIKRLGASKKTKHFATKKFWVQSLVRSKVLTIKKVLGKENVADLCTKAVDGGTLRKLLPRVGIVLLTAAGLTATAVFVWILSAAAPRLPAKALLERGL